MLTSHDVRTRTTNETFLPSISTSTFALDYSGNVVFLDSSGEIYSVKVRGLALVRAAPPITSYYMNGFSYQFRKISSLEAYNFLTLGQFNIVGGRKDLTRPNFAILTAKKQSWRKFIVAAAATAPLILIFLFILLSGAHSDSTLNTDQAITVLKPTAVSVSFVSESTVKQGVKSYNPIGPATISLSIFQQFLKSMNSPALPEAGSMYQACVQHGCDPAVMAAFFEHESGGGKYGVAAITKSVGNIRCTAGYTCFTTNGNGSFRQYPTWTAGAADWANLLLMYKNDWGCVTLEQIIPHYAPQADHNNETAYILSVKSRVDNLRNLEAQFSKK